MNKEILHTFHFSCDLASIVSAITESKHIQKWWTKKAIVNLGKGIFEWDGHGWRVELTLEKTSNNQSVVWKCIKSNMQNTAAWEGSTMYFELLPYENGTRMSFRHSGYKDSPCYDVCLEGWNFVLGKSLKSYLETGKGMPYVGS